MLAEMHSFKTRRPAWRRAVAVAVAATGLFLISAVLLLGAGASQATPTGATFAERFAFAPGGTACSQKSWPYFETACLRMPDGSQARPVRIIAIDREARR